MLDMMLEVSDIPLVRFFQDFVLSISSNLNLVKPDSDHPPDIYIIELTHDPGAAWTGILSIGIMNRGTVCHYLNLLIINLLYFQIMNPGYNHFSTMSKDSGHWKFRPKRYMLLLLLGYVWHIAAWLLRQTST